MTGLYGNRSIIPNNYYFTFDYIYKDESKAHENESKDGILIGRCVLAKAESTVLLKTVGGYIRVAKLDNEGRFALSEGYSLTELDDIDLLTGCGLTPNGDGLYVVNFDIVSKAITTDGTIGDAYSFKETGQSNDEVNEKQTGHGHWPHVRGQVDKEYLTGRTFLLRQTSSIQPVLKDDGTENNNVTLTQMKTADQLSSGVTYYYSKDGTTYTPKVLSKKDISELSSSAIGNYYVASTRTVKLYQTLTDITRDDIKDINTTRTNLNHKNKTFYRSIDAVFVSADDNYIKDNKQIGNISYFKLNDKGQFESETSKTDTTQLYVIKNIYNNDGSYYNDQEGWSDWYDITEAYTGYIGDLNPTTEGNRAKGTSTKLICCKISTTDESGNSTTSIDNYNKYNKYYDSSGNSETPTEAEYYKNPEKYYIKTNSKRDNLSDDSNLVEAINSLDEILGSSSRMKASGTVNVVRAGSLDSELDSDSRTYNIPEGNIMDALVHHDADIGQIEGVSTSLTNEEYDTYNVNFSYTDSATNTGKEATGRATINSLTDFARKLDSALGPQARLGRSSTVNASSKGNTVTGAGADGGDVRNYFVGETNAIDALVKLTADSGMLSNIDNDNLIFTNTENSSTNMVTGIKANIVSLSDAIQHMNKNIIGKVADGFTPTNNNVVNGKTLMENFNDLNSAIGDITKILEDSDKQLGEQGTSGSLNDKNKTSLSKKLNYLLENLIGYRSGYTLDYNGVLSSNSLVTNLNNLNSKIGNLSSIGGNNFDETKDLATNLQNLNKLLGNLNQQYTGVSKLNTNTTVISAINYIVESLIGEMKDKTGKNGLQPTLQEQIDTCEENINTLSENLNMTDNILDQVQLNIESNNYINWQYLA